MCLCVFLFFFFLSRFSPFPVWNPNRKEMSTLQSNVEFLTNRIINTPTNDTLANPINDLKTAPNNGYGSNAEEMIVNQGIWRSRLIFVLVFGTSNSLFWKCSLKNQKLKQDFFCFRSAPPATLNNSYESAPRQQRISPEPAATPTGPTDDQPLSTGRDQGYVGEGEPVSDKEYQQQQQSLSKQGSKERDDTEYGGGEAADLYAPESTPTGLESQSQQQAIYDQQQYVDDQYNQQPVQYDDPAATTGGEYAQQGYDDGQQNYGAADYQQYDDQQQYGGEYDQNGYDDGQQQQQQQYAGDYQPVQSEAALGYGAADGYDQQQQPQQ
jgi:hypothetical protein